MRRSAVVGELREISSAVVVTASRTRTFGVGRTCKAVRGTRGHGERLGELLRNRRRQWRLVDVLLSEKRADGG